MYYSRYRFGIIKQNGHWVIIMGNYVVFKFGLDPTITNLTIGRDWNPCNYYE